MSECNSQTVKRRRYLRRFLLLLSCLALGIVVGMVGYHFTGKQAWFLAIPGVLALVWLFIANPSECCGIEAQSRRDDSMKR